MLSGPPSDEGRPPPRPHKKHVPAAPPRVRYISIEMLIAMSVAIPLAIYLAYLERGRASQPPPSLVRCPGEDDIMNACTLDVVQETIADQWPGARFQLCAFNFYASSQQELLTESLRFPDTAPRVRDVLQTWIVEMQRRQDRGEPMTGAMAQVARWLPASVTAKRRTTGPAVTNTDILGGVDPETIMRSVNNNNNNNKGGLASA